MDETAVFDLQPRVAVRQRAQAGAIKTVVRPCIRRSSASMIAASVLVSTELVGSSRMRIGVQDQPFARVGAQDGTGEVLQLARQGNGHIEPGGEEEHRGVGACGALR
jgi:hypothetical protein